jgi:hypothetical protein
MAFQRSRRYIVRAVQKCQSVAPILQHQQTHRGLSTVPPLVDGSQEGESDSQEGESVWLMTVRKAKAGVSVPFCMLCTCRQLGWLQVPRPSAACRIHCPRNLQGIQDH